MNAYGAPALRPRFDDLNLAESSLISALTRLKVGETSWEHSFEIAGREMHVECLGNSYGFPHGPDNDMMLVLNNLYLEQGQPDNNSVHCSAYALLKMLGRTDSSQNYRIMHDSLTRLAGTLYKVSGWLDQPGGATRKVTFRFLERVEEVQGGVRNLNLKSFGAGTQLKITLDSVVAASLKSSRVRPFDLDFMLKLSGSQSRMLFRLLDTLWYSDPRAIDRGLLEFEVVELGKLLRLTNLRPDSIRRTIVPIHEELIASEFLLAAAFEGRGQQQRVRYVLNPQRPDYPLTVEQLEFVGRIKTLGISDVQARAYVRKHPPARVRDRLQMVAAILSGTSRIRKSPAAYAWDILTDETGKYTYVPPAVSSGEAGSSGAAGNSGVGSMVQGALETGVQRQQDAKEASEKDLDERIQSLRQLAPDEQWAQHRASLKLLLHRPLGADLWKVLESRCTSGRLEAATLLSEVNTAIAGLELQALMEHLRAELKAPQG
ncbi:replication initiator protein A [Deinococcus sp. UYEF24]